MAKTQTAEPTVINRVLEQAGLVRSESQRQHAMELLNEYATQVLDEGMTVGKHSTVAGIKRRIAEIDQMLSDQMNAILHDPEFQKLEGSWRGLASLVEGTGVGNSVKIRLMNATKAELLADIEKAAEFDQSALFKKIYEEEFGTFGGTPFSCLVGDFEFDGGAQDMELLTGISQVAAASHAPFITAASPELFNMESFSELSNPRDLAKVLDSSELARWRSFRESDDSRFVAMTLPRVLGRAPYGPEINSDMEFDFVEDVDGSNHASYLWTNSAYALAGRITESFNKTMWCGSLRGVAGGGLVENLPVHAFISSEGDLSLKCPTEVAITDRREAELNSLGFIALCHRKNSDQAVFFGSQTANKPVAYDTDEANSNAQVSAMLPYVMVASRFSHYLKSIMRDKVGSNDGMAEIQADLNRWLSNYVLLNTAMSDGQRARFPLSEGRVEVVEVPGRPGAYRAVLFLRPNFQLDELSASIRLVADLPGSTSTSTE